MSHGGGRGPGRAFSMLKERSRTRPTKLLLSKFWYYLKSFKSSLILVSMIILIYTAAATISPVIIQRAIDKMIDDPQSGVILSSVILFILLSVIVWIFQSWNTWIMARIRTKLVHKIRTETFEKLVDADMTYHHTEQSGNVTSRVINDTEEISNGLTVFTTASTQLLLVIATFVILVTINPLFAVIALLAIPVAIIITGIIGTIGRKRMLQVRRAYGEVSAKLAESLSGVIISKSFNREERTSSEIRQLNRLTYDYMKQLGLLFMLIMPSIFMISTILVALIMLVGGYFYSNPGGFFTEFNYFSSSGMTIGTIYLGTVMVQRFLMPIVHMASYFTQLQASLAAMDRIFDVTEATPAVHDSIYATLLIPTDPSISFDNVTFEYEKNIPVVKDVSFQIQAGEKIALVGITGAGKTTITSLLMRFYDPKNGNIFIGNQNLRGVTLESLHDNVSLVSQEPYLFADTVLENIRYGRLDATNQEIYDLCKLIGADQFIEALPEGYQTKLTESGKSLSAGQRQMITIARTMLSDPKILILDEATSRLDAYSESLVQIAQNKLFEGRTTVVIAHRLSTIRDVNRIFVLDRGELIEQGTHEELMKKKGKYHELYQAYYAHQGVRSLDELIISEIKLLEEHEQITKFPHPDARHSKFPSES